LAAEPTVDDVPLVTYKDLCIDANDAVRLGSFWAAVLRLDLHRLDNGNVLLSGPTPQHTIWINAVPEPVTVKQRVHFDLGAESVAEIVALGATVVDAESFGWQVLRDPEGGEFCVFENVPVPSHRLHEIIVDCADAKPIAAWWAEVLGARIGDDAGPENSYIDEIPGAPFENLLFVPVPEPKTVKNRIHLDFVCSDVGALVDHGAKVLRDRDGTIDWTVLADPDGNEFCAFLPADE
jgi:hypothetical protein